MRQRLLTDGKALSAIGGTDAGSLSFNELDAVLLGCSAQKPAAIQESLIDRQLLTVPFLSDPSKTLIAAFGAKNPVGDTFRQTFILDPSGTIRWIERNVELMLVRGARVLPADLKKYSPHSYRIWMCSALVANNCPRPTIKRLLRWRGDESLDTYGRVSDPDWQRHIIGTYHAHVDATTARRLPGMGLQPVVVDLDAAAAHFVANA